VSCRFSRGVKLKPSNNGLACRPVNMRRFSVLLLAALIASSWAEEEVKEEVIDKAVYKARVDSCGG